ncbi:MAG: hypothetical protein GC151_20050 [Betaproteobacteria bacterium]|nr:hypothetical protein [Betaproteobacteria bacterium]
MFSLKRWRRRRAIARVVIDENTWRVAVARYGFVRSLSSEDITRLRDLVALFLDAKSFSAADGLELTDDMMLAIAIQACVLILNLDFDYFDGWVEIIVYPVEFVPAHSWVDDSGVVHHDHTAKAGEAWLHGPLVLSWADVERADADDGVNVVIHEFAHKLDMLNGDANGYPPLHKGMRREDWARALGGAYEDFRHRVARRRHTEIDPYAAESPGEFFAVFSEAFFEIPEVVAHEYPEVYAQLSLFYRQDPLARLERAEDPS